MIKYKKITKEIIFITLGTILLSIGIGGFFAPNNIVTGGFSGLSIIIADVSKNIFGRELKVWLTNMILNIPLLVISLRSTSMVFVLKTLYATILLSACLYVVGLFSPLKLDFILTSIYGGMLSGGGLGLVFKGYASTGGTDLVAILINKFVKHIPVSKLILCLDTCIIILGLFVFGYEKALYAILAVYISSKSIDVVLEGFNFSKVAFIISEQAKDISTEIIKTLNRGVTSLDGKGMYTNTPKNILFVVVSIKEITILKDIVNKIDKKSFVIVADVREVLGEGFKNFT